MNQVFIDAQGASVARPMTANSSRLFRRAVPVLIGLLLLARLIGMAVVPLMDTTEARYGETGRIMAELNDWITPWFDYGVPFWGKPPLAFWVTAASFKAFGVNEFAARLPHLAISLFIVGLVAWLAGRRDRDAALPTVALITGSFLFFISAAVVMIDIELILGTTLAMAGFWLAVEAPDSRSTGRACDSLPGVRRIAVLRRHHPGSAGEGSHGLGHDRHPNALLDGLQPPLARRLAPSAVAFRGGADIAAGAALVLDRRATHTRLP